MLVLEFFPSDTVLSMRLPDSSVFTADVWAIIKAMEQIKDSIASKYIVFTDSLSCLQALHRMKLEHPLIGMVIRKCVFLNVAKKKTCFFVGYPSIMALRAMKRQTLLPSLHWICLVPRLVYPIVILNIVSANMFFPLGTMIGMVRSRTSFILSSQSYRRCRTDEVVLYRARIGHTHLTHSYILRKDPPPQCEHCQCILTVRHILVECNHFARERKNIYGRRDVVESLRFHPTLIVIF